MGARGCVPRWQTARARMVPELGWAAGTLIIMPLMVSTLTSHYRCKCKEHPTSSWPSNHRAHVRMQMRACRAGVQCALAGPTFSTSSTPTFGYRKPHTCTARVGREAGQETSAPRQPRAPARSEAGQQLCLRRGRTRSRGDLAATSMVAFLLFGSCWLARPASATYRVLLWAPGPFNVWSTACHADTDS